jgi:demethylmenaquinone methyltransferase/2-methoxy-6-polyprenyl-1,4-benzoquinol methylase
MFVDRINETVFGLSTKFKKTQQFWDKLAPLWDFYLLISGLKEKYRKEAIDKLNLSRGDRVLDLACGTGLNFKHLREKVGDKGEIVGLDYSSKMLGEAKKKIKDNNWDNVMLVQKTAEKLGFKDKFDAVLCTGRWFPFPIIKRL